jgi:elongation factor Ts
MSDFLNNIKVLRDRTGISISECKKALLASNNDIESSIVFLRKSGASIVESKSNRQAVNGVIATFVSNDKKDGVIIEVNCETDFVSKSPDFLNYVSNLCNYFSSKDFIGKNFYLKDNDIILNKELIDLKIDLVSKLRENLVVKRVLKIFSAEGFLFSYLHFDFKIGVILNISKDDDLLAKDILIQIASMKPKYLSLQDIPADVLSFERQIAFDKLKNKYPEKNDMLLSKMVDGQINKFYNDNVLLEQNFVKDGKKFIKQIIYNKINVISFEIFSVNQS